MANMITPDQLIDLQKKVNAKMDSLESQIRDAINDAGKDMGLEGLTIQSIFGSIHLVFDPVYYDDLD